MLTTRTHLDWLRDLALDQTYYLSEERQEAIR